MAPNHSRFNLCLLIWSETHLMVFNMVHSWRATTTTGKQQGNLAMSKMASSSHGCRYFIGVKSICHILSSQMLGRPYVPDEK